MAEQVITCPHCGQPIELTEALTNQIESTIRAGLKKEHVEALKAKDLELEEMLAKERRRLTAKLKEEADASVQTEMVDLQTRVEEQSKEIEAAEKLELDMRKKQRELEAKAKGAELEILRRVDEERKKIQEAAAKSSQEEFQLKLREKDEQLKGMNAQIEELKRRADQSSQQLRGEVQELELEDLLRAKFAGDDIRPTKTGARGADVLQDVHNGFGERVGSILWESKRTKAWSPGWIQKLKDDQRREKADIAVIVSAVLPKEVNHLGYVDGVWIVDLASAEGLATALRAHLIAVARAGVALFDKSEKMELLYDYLSGPQFHRRIETIVDSFRAMKSDLDTERRSMERVWAKREQQLGRVLLSTAGMYGELEGIVGGTLPAIDTLELPSGEGG